jgi:hypothetical protein
MWIYRTAVPMLLSRKRRLFPTRISPLDTRERVTHPRGCGYISLSLFGFRLRDCAATRACGISSGASFGSLARPAVTKGWEGGREEEETETPWHTFGPGRPGGSDRGAGPWKTNGNECDEVRGNLHQGWGCAWVGRFLSAPTDKLLRRGTKSGEEEVAGTGDRQLAIP